MMDNTERSRTTMVTDLYNTHPAIDHRIPHSPSVPSFSPDEPNPRQEMHSLAISDAQMDKQKTSTTDGDDSKRDLHKRLRDPEHDCRWAQSEETELMMLCGSMGKRLTGWNNLSQWDILAQTMHKNLTSQGHTVPIKTGLQCRNKWRNMRRKHSALTAAQAKLAVEGLTEDDIVIPHYFTQMKKILAEAQQTQSSDSGIGREASTSSNNGSEQDHNATRTLSKSKTAKQNSGNSKQGQDDSSSPPVNMSKLGRSVLSKSGEKHLIQLLDHFKNMMDESLRKEDEFWDRLMEMQTKMQQSQQEFTLAVLDKLAQILGSPKDKTPNN